MARIRGAGDVVSAMAGAIGIDPCDGCKRREATLNHWAPLVPPPKIAPVWSPGTTRHLLLDATVDVSRALGRLSAHKKAFNGRKLAAHRKGDSPPAGFEGVIVAKKAEPLIELLAALDDQREESAAYCALPTTTSDFRVGIVDGFLLRCHRVFAPALETTGIVGAARYGKRDWRYIANRFWLRLDTIYARNWRYVPRGGIDRWPESMFTPSEAACLIWDGYGETRERVEAALAGEG